MSTSEQRRDARSAAVSLYVWMIGLTAVAAGTVLAFVTGSVLTIDRWPEVLLFSALVVACEMKPVPVVRKAGMQDVVASTTFAFAMFLAFGPLIAIAAQVVASVLADVRDRKAFVKAMFNVVQYAMAWSLAGLTFSATAGPHAFGGDLALDWRWLGGTFAAGCTYFLANNILVAGVMSISGGESLIATVAHTVRAEASSDAVLLALSPIVVVVGERHWGLLPLLLLPVLAVYRSASVTAEKEHQAMHDSLSGLPNRLQFYTEMHRRLEDESGRSKRTALLIIDLNRFKEVNDTLGHQAGDALLCQIGPRIAAVLPEGGIIARLGGDEFAVSLAEVASATEALEVGQQIAAAIDRPFSVEGFNLEIEASIGVAVFPEHGSSTKLLMKRADIAMYVAKSNHSAVELYDADKDHHSTRRLGLLSELRNALASDEVRLHYQPKLDLITGEVSGVEALIRWEHPAHGSIAPSEFVPLAEHTGLIRPLTSYVLRTAVAQARSWMDQGYDIAVAANLSPRNLHDGAVIEEIAALLREFSLPPRLLQLEITEGSIMADPLRARRILEQLDQMGVHMSIDDFGTGYSSLAYLQDLPVREVKIDRSFVSNVLDNQRDQVIVRSTIELAHNLNLRATAEGVESLAAQRWLQAAGCDHAQGFSISRPLTAEAVTEWLQQRSGAVPAEQPHGPDVHQRSVLVATRGQAC